MTLFSLLKDLLSPKICYWCKKKWKFLCDDCYSQCNNYEWFCYVCKKKSGFFAIHKKCLIDNKLYQWKNFNNAKLYMDRCIVLTQYSHPYIKKLITHFKFRWKKDIWVELSQKVSVLVREYIRDNNIQESDIIILPVPLHWTRKLMRGFNQSEILAKRVWQLININYIDNILERKIYTKQQSKLSQEQRLSNLSNVFSIKQKKKHMIDKKTVILIDDVISSGTTLNEIAKLLKMTWSHQVIGVTLASN